ncbi:serine/threonine-protein kinase [Streptomyces sp. NPDC087440]|uniref:serine/threonine-protein kinase n=1 Tax=Streptomyces sp. NPDC087440 TaxID=3365790 RepID=UPI00381CDC24
MATGGETSRVIGGRYRLAERLGAGGMGAVWAGRDLVVDRDVAVKEAYVPERLPEGSPERDALLERILREARAAARVNHRAVVTVHDVVVEDGRPWIVMERVRGESLEDRLHREGALPEREAARIGLAVAEALRAAHGRGVLHRDVKPGNVLLSEDDGGRVVLSDFGIAYIEGDEPLTRSGEFVGSLEYTAPERMGGNRPGPASDLWSLGVLLFRMVEGWSPFRRDSLEGTVTAVVMADAPKPERAVELRPLIVRLAAKDPEGRPESEAVVAALRAVAEQPAAPAVVRPGAGRRQALIASVAAVVVLAGATGAYVALQGDGPGDVAAGPKAASTPSAALSPTPSAPKPAALGVEDAFRIEVPAGWTRLGKNGRGQYRYQGAGLELVVVPGRDSTATFGSDPVRYQTESEPETQAVRLASWATASGMREIAADGQTGVERRYTWKDGAGRDLYGWNRVLVHEGRYHTVSVNGPESSRAAVDEVYAAVAPSYRVRN